MKESFVKQNEILSLSKAFALRIVRLHRYMVSNKREFVLSQQLLRSGTSIGANIKEAQFAQSKADFIAKMYIALKESGETEYWLELLYDAGYLMQKELRLLQFVWRGWEESKQRFSPFPRVATPCSSRISA